MSQMVWMRDIDEKPATLREPATWHAQLPHVQYQVYEDNMENVFLLEI